MAVRPALSTQEFKGDDVDFGDGAFYRRAVFPEARAQRSLDQHACAPADIFFGKFSRRVSHHYIMPLGPLGYLCSVFGAAGRVVGCKRKGGHRSALYIAQLRIGSDVTQQYDLIHDCGI